jgi:hypothetical protein
MLSFKAIWCDARNIFRKVWIKTYSSFSIKGNFDKKDNFAAKVNAINNLLQVIFSNGFPHLHKFKLVKWTISSSTCQLWTGSVALRSLELSVERANDYECVLHACPHLRWFESKCLAWDRGQVLFNPTSHPTVEHFELSCSVLSTLPTVLSLTPNVKTLKLQIYTRTSDLSQLASILHNTLPKLNVFRCEVIISTHDTNLHKTIRLENIQKLHPLFQVVTIVEHKVFPKGLNEEQQDCYIRLLLQSFKKMRQQRSWITSSVFSTDF